MGTKEQQTTIKRLFDLVEKARDILADAPCLDVLEGPEGQNLSELESRLSDAYACLMALGRQLAR
jgi:hypothetical protein